MLSIEDLPDELLTECVAMLPVSSINNVSRVNRHFNSIVKNEYLWQQLCKLQFRIPLEKIKNDNYRNQFRKRHLRQWRLDDKFTEILPYPNQGDRIDKFQMSLTTESMKPLKNCFRIKVTEMKQWIQIGITDKRLFSKRACLVCYVSDKHKNSMLIDFHNKYICQMPTIATGDIIKFKLNYDKYQVAVYHNRRRIIRHSLRETDQEIYPCITLPQDTKLEFVY